MSEQARVFLSYRRADTQHVAGRVADQLATRFDLFMDIEAIPPGVDFAEFLQRAVGSCDVLLAFIGDRWLEPGEDGRRRIDDPADWVAGEIAAALARGIAVIPVLVEAAILPTAERLPEPLAPLAQRQSVRLRHASFSADLAHLIAGIEHAVRARSSAVPVGPAAPAPGRDPFDDDWAHRSAPAPAKVPTPIAIPERRGRRTPILVGIVGLLVATVVGAVWVLGRGPLGPTALGAQPGVTTPSASPASPPAPTPAPASTAAELQRRVPDTYRRTCKAISPESAALRAGLLVAVQCTPAQGSGEGRQPTYSFYFQYTGAEAATTAFHAYYAAGRSGDGDCSGAPGEVVDPRPGSGPGTLRCYTDEEQFRVFAWTSDATGVLASAADRAMSYPELYRWWLDAGPLR